MPKATLPQRMVRCSVCRTHLCECHDSAGAADHVPRNGEVLEQQQRRREVRLSERDRARDRDGRNSSSSQDQSQQQERASEDMFKF